MDLDCVVTEALPFPLFQAVIPSPLDSDGRDDSVFDLKAGLFAQDLC